VSAGLATDLLAERAGTHVVEATSERAIVVQADAPALSNHVGVRHASAVYLAALAAAQRLVTAVTPERWEDSEARLIECDMRYGAVPTGTIVFTAVCAEGSVVDEGDVRVRVVAEVDGREVATMSARWTATVAAAEAT
jgi:hypothetical protein